MGAELGPGLPTLVSLPLHLSGKKKKKKKKRRGREGEERGSAAF